MLPLYNFVKCLTSNDLKYLIKEGEPHGLEAVWEKISEEYAAASGDKQNEYLIQINVQIEFLRNELATIQTIVNYLSKRRSEVLIKELQQGYGFRFTYEDLEGDLIKTVALSKSKVVKLERLKAELEGVQHKAEKETEVSVKQWFASLSFLSKWQGFHVSPYKVTVLEYLTMIEAYNNQPKA